MNLSDKVIGTPLWKRLRKELDSRTYDHAKLSDDESELLEVIYEWSERAAIRTWDGKQPKRQAEVDAWEDVKRRHALPPPIPKPVTIEAPPPMKQKSKGLAAMRERSTS